MEGAKLKTNVPSNRYWLLDESSGEEDDEAQTTKTTAAGKASGKQGAEEVYSRKKLNRLKEENEKLKKQVAELREEMELQLAKAEQKNKYLQEVVNGLVMQQDLERSKAAKAKKQNKATPAAAETAADEDPFYLAERKGKGGKRRRLTETISVAGEPDNSKRDTPPRRATPIAPPRADKMKIPPVVLRNKGNWIEVQEKLQERQIKFKGAKLIRDGIAINPSSAEDHRKLTEALSKDKQEYHTYSLPEDRPLRVVIRGLPTDLPERDIKEDLARQGFEALSVQRMTDRRTRQPIPLVLVQVSADKTNVLQVRRCCNLSVRTEMQRGSRATTQCHRCQRFGHGQSRCTAQQKCVKCGDNHASRECVKPRETPARCANCGGPHPASYRGCPSFPKPRRNVNRRREETQNRPHVQNYRPVTNTTSYADAAKPTRKDEAELDKHAERLEEQQTVVPGAQQEAQPEEQSEMEVTYETEDDRLIAEYKKENEPYEERRRQYEEEIANHYRNQERKQNRQ